MMWNTGIWNQVELLCYLYFFLVPFEGLLEDLWPLSSTTFPQVTNLWEMLLLIKHRSPSGSRWRPVVPSVIPTGAAGDILVQRRACPSFGSLTCSFIPYQWEHGVLGRARRLKTMTMSYVPAFSFLLSVYKTLLPLFCVGTRRRKSLMSFDSSFVWYSPSAFHCFCIIFWIDNIEKNLSF